MPMHTENLSQWTHDHVFSRANPSAERSTRAVMWIGTLNDTLRRWGVKVPGSVDSQGSRADTPRLNMARRKLALIEANL